MSASEDTLSVGSVVSLGSARRRLGRYSAKMPAVGDAEALYDMVASLAKGMDRLTAEVSDNTRAVDELSALVRELVNGKK